MEGKDARQKGWFWLENNLIDREDIEAYEKLLYMALARYADSKGKCFPGLERLMKVSGIGSRKTLTKYLRSLEAKGLVEIKKTSGKGNVYFLKNVSNKPGAEMHVGAKMTRVKSTPTPGAEMHVHQVQKCTPKETQLRKPNKEDVVNNINTARKENNATETKEQQHQVFVLNLAKKEMSKLCNNQFAVETALMAYRNKIQSLYKFLGKEKFLETFEKIHESSYLKEQSKNTGQFFNWLFSSKKENFLNVFNDIYADNDKKPSAIDEAITVFVEPDKNNFDFSMWED